MAVLPSESYFGEVGPRTCVAGPTQRRVSVKLCPSKISKTVSDRLENVHLKRLSRAVVFGRSRDTRELDMRYGQTKFGIKVS